jgi:hypothetical protein
MRGWAAQLKPRPSEKACVPSVALFQALSPLYCARMCGFGHLLVLSLVLSY